MENVEGRNSDSGWCSVCVHSAHVVLSGVVSEDCLVGKYGGNG